MLQLGGPHRMLTGIVSYLFQPNFYLLATTTKNLKNDGSSWHSNTQPLAAPFPKGPAEDGFLLLRLSSPPPTPSITAGITPDAARRTGVKREQARGCCHYRPAICGEIERLQTILSCVNESDVAS